MIAAMTHKAFLRGGPADGKCIILPVERPIIEIAVAPPPPPLSASPPKEPDRPEPVETIIYVQRNEPEYRHMYDYSEIAT